VKSTECKHSDKQTVGELDAERKVSNGVGEIVIGMLVDFNSPGRPLVSYPGVNHKQAMSALTTIPINKQHIGRQVALLFTDGDIKQPVVIGLIQTCLDEETNDSDEIEIQSKVMIQEERKNIHETKVDGERLVFEAEKEIEIKCGKSSIVLTKAGKVLIKGKYLSARSSGVNRIKGGSVLIN